MGRRKHRITPPNGQTAESWLSQFGNNSELARTLESLGKPTSSGTIGQWKKHGIPKDIYLLLSQVIDTRETINVSDHTGYLEIYYRGKPVGQFHIAKDINIVLKQTARKELNYEDIIGPRKSGASE